MQPKLFTHIPKNDDLSAYLNKRITLPIVNKGIYNTDYKLYYDETREMVQDWYRLEIDYWGFTFEGSATKNYWKSNENL